MNVGIQTVFSGSGRISVYSPNRRACIYSFCRKGEPLPMTLLLFLPIINNPLSCPPIHVPSHELTFQFLYQYNF